MIINQRNKINQIDKKNQQNTNDLKNLNRQTITCNSNLFARQITEIILYQGEVIQPFGSGGVG